MSRFTHATVVALLFAASVTSPAFAEDDSCRKAAPDVQTDLPLLFCDNFESGRADHWAPGDPDAWKVTNPDGDYVYEQHARSQVKNPVRSPFNRCLLKDHVVGSFVLDLKFQSTTKDYPHRDLCLFFGFQDPKHFYYVHFGKRTDAHANQIFIVNEAPRTKISTKTTDGTAWDDEWHHARIERDVASGEIKVYFDDMNTPVMTATDKTFTWGKVGIGSFDDTGDFEMVKLYGSKVEKP